MGNFWSRFDHFVGTMRSTNPCFLIFFNVLSFENSFDFQNGTKISNWDKKFQIGTKNQIGTKKKSNWSFWLYALGIPGGLIGIVFLLETIL